MVSPPFTKLPVMEKSKLIPYRSEFSFCPESESFNKACKRKIKRKCITHDFRLDFSQVCHIIQNIIYNP